MITNRSAGVLMHITSLPSEYGIGTLGEESYKEFKKMDEKGYFKFGGSTVIMVFETDRVRFDEDILTASAQDMEVLVRCGSHIADVK